MNFKYFENHLDKPEGIKFERTLSETAVVGDWLNVERMLRELSEDMPDKQLKLTLLNDIDPVSITCDSWPTIQRAVHLGMPTHLVLQIDVNALEHVLDPQNVAPDDDCAVGFTVSLADRGSIDDARAHAEALATNAASNSWSVKAYGSPSAAYIKGLNHVYRAMRVALFDDAEMYPQKQFMAMYRISGWWISLSINRYIARFCSEWALEPQIPIFVSSNLGGGRLLGWHIPKGDQCVEPLPIPTNKELRKKPSELSTSAMLHWLESDIRYRVCHMGHEPTPDEKAFIAERHFNGGDPQPWFNLYKTKTWNSFRSPEPLSEEHIAYRTQYVREQQERRIANGARREKSRRENMTASARMSMIDEFQEEFRRREEARNLARKDHMGNRRANRKMNALQEEARATFEDVDAMIGGLLSQKGSPAGEQIKNARNLVSTLFRILK